MKNFLKSIFYRGAHARASDKTSGEAADPLDAPQVGADADSDAEAADSPSKVAVPAQGFTLEEIVADLVVHVCTTMPDPRSPEEIDPRIHMYDAGYVTSITAADLLAHIEARYGVDISETKLIGPLQNLETLARHIQSPSSW